MPVEIRELTIKVNLDDTNNQGGNSAAGTSSGGDIDAQKAIVEACVEKVLEILKEKAER
jgi:hypothetical protein